jgi:hypothetical protein
VSGRLGSSAETAALSGLDILESGDSTGDGTINGATWVEDCPE